MNDPARERALLVEALRVEGISDARVLDAIGAVERHRFVPEQWRDRAYENRALPIGDGQTISQPLVIALSLQALRLTPESCVLEIGTGSGYQAALLAHLAGRVLSVERLPTLLSRARSAIDTLSANGKVELHLGDGSAGWPEAAPYDAIVVAAGAPDVPRPLFEQLAPGGRLVAPVGGRRDQVLKCWRRRDVPGFEFDEENLCSVRFVPLIGEHGWHGASE